MEQVKLPAVTQYGKRELYDRLRGIGTVKVSYRTFRRWLYTTVFVDDPKEKKRVQNAKILQPRQVKIIFKELAG
jgi:hypothetical protein